MSRTIALTQACCIAALLPLSIALPSHAQDRYGNWVASTDPLPPERERQKFHLPPGFEIQLVAAEPEIRKPINMAFDRRGRLWVTESIEYPIPARKKAVPRDAVKIFDAFGGDGRAGRVTTFADHLNIPIGVLPTLDGAIVYSIPNVQHLIDSDGDDKADRREVLLGPFMFEDTHAMVNAMMWGFDGWIYACHGYHNVSKISGTDGRKLELHMGSTFRFRPDGSQLERVTQGRVNPFGMCVDPWERFFSADCHSRPFYELIRGAWYPSFEEPDDGLGFAPETCDHDHGSTAIAGIVCYSGQNFPAEYVGTVFTGNVVTNRINHDKLVLHGSSSRAVHQRDFLVCDDPWFRPVDMKVAPDGSIYVADFYDRVIAHDEVPLDHPGRDNTHGRIWRIVFKPATAVGAERSAPPLNKSQTRRGEGGQGGVRRAEALPQHDLSGSAKDELIADLGQPNLTIRMLAMNELIDRIGKPAIEPLRAVCRKDDRPERRVHSLWALERLGGLTGDLLQNAAADPEEIVRTHAMGILRERPTWAADERALIAAGLRDAHPLVQRAAVEAIARHVEPDLLGPLFELRRHLNQSDPQLLHAARIALRDAFGHTENWTRWANDARLRENADLLADVAVGIGSTASAEFLLGYVQEREVEVDLLRRFGRHITRYLPEPELPALFGQMGQIGGSALKRQVALAQGLCEGLQQRGAKPSQVVVERAEDLASRLLDTGRDEDFAVAAELARIIKLQRLEGRLVTIASTASLPVPRRKAACDALVAIRVTAHLDLLGQILGNGEEPAALREHAVVLLGGVRSERAVGLLARNLVVAPSDLALVIARALARSKSGAQQMLDFITDGKASPQLLIDRQVHETMTHARMPGVEKRIAALTSGLESTDQKLRELVAERKAGFLRSHGDPNRGAAVFQKTCAICHRIGTVGVKIGPELEGIGTRGLDRLLEDTLEPSRNVDRAFRQVIIEMQDGTSYSGLRRGEEGETVVIADSQGQTIVIPKNEIKDRWSSSLSPMPSNIATDLPEKDYYDLLAFLLSQRQATTTSAPTIP